MPQVSIPDESVKFNYDSQRQYILFQGTEVMQGKTRQGNYCKAVVIRTGQGNLLMLLIDLLILELDRLHDHQGRAGASHLVPSPTRLGILR